MEQVKSQNAEIYKKLGKQDKDKIMMYTTARQFKNAVPIEEMLIIPSEIGEWNEHCKITLNNLNLNDFIIKYGIKENSKVQLNDQSMITARGNRIISKQTPFIVNKAFACEVYLKIILLESNLNFKKHLKRTEQHYLFELYNLTSTEFKNDFLKVIKNKFSNIDDKLKNISKAFIDWRYIYEKYETIASLDFLFLDEFCNYLDEYARQIIYENYGYDVSKNIL